MKTISQAAVITPSIILLACARRCSSLHRRDKQKGSTSSNIRVDIILLVIIGMTICTQGGIGRVSAHRLGRGSLEEINWVLARGYQVHAKDYYGVRAKALTESVSEWITIRATAAAKSAGWPSKQICIAFQSSGLRYVVAGKTVSGAGSFRGNSDRLV